MRVLAKASRLIVVCGDVIKRKGGSGDENGSDWSSFSETEACVDGIENETLRRANTFIVKVLYLNKCGSRICFGYG